MSERYAMINGEWLRRSCSMYRPCYQDLEQKMFTGYAV